MGAKQYRPWDPTQMYLLPPSPLEWLPDGHLAYFILDVVRELDLRAIEGAIQSKDARGERPYSPLMMTALLLYGYSVGVFSSRKIARGTYEDVAFRVLSGDTHPHFSRINQFRLDHKEALAGLFMQVLLLCKKAGLVKLGHVALDGSKVSANASKHKAMSYKRMKKEERRLQAEVETLFARAAETDRREDERYGQGQDLEDLPEELRRREDRLLQIRRAKQSLEKDAAWARVATLKKQAREQRDKADDESASATERKRAGTLGRKAEQKARAVTKDNDDEMPPTGGGLSDELPQHRVAAEIDGTPKPDAQRCFTDPDSRIMQKSGAVMQGYNAQIVVDGHAQVIVAEAVTNQAPDTEHLPAMLDRVIENCGQVPDAFTADTGYFSERNVSECERRGVDAFIAVGRKLDDNAQRGSLAGAPASSAQESRDRMRKKLLTTRGKAIYALRKSTAEPPFGQIKEVRGFRRFGLRGLDKVRCEWSLVCLTHNLLKLFRAGSAATLLA